MSRRNGVRRFNRRHGNRDDGSWASTLMSELHPRETLPEKPEELSVKDLEPHGKAGPPPEGNCAYCGRPLRKGEGHWVIDEWGQLARKCNDTRSCYERMGEDNRKSFKRALRRFGPRGGM